MSNYDIDIKKFSEEEYTLKSLAPEFFAVSTSKKDLHDCKFCKRYSNSDPKGVLVHIVKSHKDILRLIKQCR